MISFWIFLCVYEILLLNFTQVLKIFKITVMYPN